MRNDIIAFYRRCGKTELDNRKHTQRNEYEIIQISEGSGTVLLGGEIYPMTKGGAYLINAKFVHMTVPINSDGYIRSIVKFDSRMFQSFLETVNEAALSHKLFSEKAGYHFDLNESDAKIADQYFGEISTLNSNDTVPFSDLRLIIKISELILFLFSRNGSENKFSRHSVTNEILKYIDTSFIKRITLEDISKKVRISKFHMCRTFKKDAGMTVLEYLTSRRIEYAKERLITEKTAVSVIAQDSGFESYPYFTSLFKKHTGYSPSEYRKKYAQK